MMSDHTYDVVFPILGLHDLVPLSVSSVLNQTLPYSNFIVIIDGSPDESDEIVSYFESLPRVLILFSSHYGVRGAGSCRQVGILASRASHVAFLDSDDIWHHDKCRLQLNLIAKSSSHLCSTSYIAMNQSLDKSHFVSLAFLPISLSLLYISNYIGNSTVMVNRKYLVSCDGYSNLAVRNDYHTWLRLLRSSANIKCCSIRNIMCIISKRADSLSFSHRTSVFSLVPVYRALGSSVYASMFQSLIFSAVAFLFVRPFRIICLYILRVVSMKINPIDRGSFIAPSIAK